MLKYGLIGDPIDHSKSPQMQTAALKAAGINGEYRLLNQSGEALATIVARLRAENVAGFNVTTPFKQAIIPYLDGIDVVAETIAAVNTVVNVDGRWIGYSTDGPGFWQSLPTTTRKQKVALIGAGGAAKSLISACPANVELTVYNRESVNFNVYATQLKAIADLELQPLSQLTTDIANFDIVINATSVGLHDNVSVLAEAMLALLPTTALVVDLVYKHEQTAFLAAAVATGHATLGGLPMLVMQGALSFTLWHQQPANIEKMQQSLV